MKIKVRFAIFKKSPIEGDPNRIVGIDFEGMLVGFGLDTGKEGGSWSTGIVITPEGNFNNIPVERLMLVDPFKADDWPV